MSDTTIVLQNTKQVQQNTKQMFYNEEFIKKMRETHARTIAAVTCSNLGK